MPAVQRRPYGPVGAKKDQVQAQEEPRYAMPRPVPGSRVNWYPSGNLKEPHLAIVKKVYAEKIECHDTLGGVNPKICFHKDHPDVKAKKYDISDPDSGLWDFIPEEVEGEKWRNRVNETIKNLERRLEDLEAALARSKPAKAEQSLQFTDPQDEPDDDEEVDEDEELDAQDDEGSA